MSDIFISYSKADHALALKLSAYLESEGWTVWWDKSLGAADLYRDEIMKQLAAARAVITIWSPNSVKSDWVRAEAGRAKADGKLIPVKTTDVAYGDIPLPFGEMHTENISSTELIRAAIVGQLTKPTVTPSPFWQITSTFKYQVLTWIGIVGSAITLFANLNGVLNLADWAREIATHWHEWNQVIWGWLFGWIKIRIPKELTPGLSFFVFAAMVVIGANLSQRTGAMRQGARHLPEYRQPPGRKRPIIEVLKIVMIWVAGLIIYLITGLIIYFLAVYTASQFGTEPDNFGGSIVIMIMVFVPTLYLLFVVKQRMLVMINSLLFIAMSLCVLVSPLNTYFNVYRVLSGDFYELPEVRSCFDDLEAYKFGLAGKEYKYGMNVGKDLTEQEVRRVLEDPEVVRRTHECQMKTDLWTYYSSLSAGFLLVLLPMCWMAVILFSPLKPLTRRLGFVVLGVITLVALSEISKLNLHQYLQPPKVSDNLVR